MEIKYKKTGRKVWKYELLEDAKHSFRANESAFRDVTLIETPFYKIEVCIFSPKDEWVMLEVKQGYAWDGLTCFPDRKEWLAGALVHDVLLQAIYDDKVLSKRALNESHRVMRGILKQTSEKHWAHLIYVGLLAFHKPWNWIKSHV
jgi:hypothetical protein